MFIRNGVAVFVLISSTAFAQTVPEPEIRDGKTLQVQDLKTSLAAVQAGSVIVLGEQHGTSVHQAYQLKVMDELRARGLNVNVGMEFLEAPSQIFVDQFRAGLLSEADFLAAVNWGAAGFEFYREQIRFPREPQKTIALNVPRPITAKLARNGIGGLSADDLQFLPESFLKDGRGNSVYFERFKQTMSGHITDPTKLENYFLAQSAWDDTMAWHASEYLSANPHDVLVIVVGDFHVTYGGGLPDRLRHWGVRDVVTVSMVNRSGLTEVEKLAAMTPDGSYGVRADWIWLADF